MGARGHAAVDRELYIPRSWTCDPDRCRAAGLGEETVFATKPELARTMIERFLDAGHRVGRVTGDEVYGGNPKLRTALQQRGTGYVLAVACPAEVSTGAGKFRANALAAKLPKRAWPALGRSGAKGRRFYDWAVIDLAGPGPGRRQLLIRRNRTTGELAYYRCLSPRPVPLTELVRVAGSRWRVEETFQAEKGLAGLDEHQCAATPPGPAGSPEIQRLFITLVVQPVHDASHRLGWSDWRRRHQARSRTSHFQMTSGRCWARCCRTRRWADRQCAGGG